MVRVCVVCVCFFFIYIYALCVCVCMCVSFSPPRILTPHSLLSTATTIGKLRTFDLTCNSQANPVATLAGHSRGVRCLKRNDDGTAFASGGMDQLIRLHA